MEKPSNMCLRVLPGLILLLAACAGPRQVATVPAQLETVKVTARNFSFTPDLIRTQPERTLDLEIKNASAGEHNFTVKNPAGDILVSRDLPPGGTVNVTVPLREAGGYSFYCDKPFHSILGMKGRLLAEPAPADGQER